jgi:hypothetical protein
MSAPHQQLDHWLQAAEDEHLEFKEAKNRFDFEELTNYCDRSSGPDRFTWLAEPRPLSGTPAPRRWVPRCRTKT